MSHRTPARPELPSLDVATVAWFVDVCGRLTHVLLQRHGDELEASWAAAELEQPVAGVLQPKRQPRTR